MQERHPSYKESVKQRRVPLFTGLAGQERWYVVHWQAFCKSESNLTGDQVKLDPTMDVRDNIMSLWLPLTLNMEPARRAQDRR
jgi:hypothetical protein